MSDQSNVDGDHRPPRQRSEGGQLRDRLERALAENRKLRSAVVDQIAAQHRHVSTDDFADVLTPDALAELDIGSITTRAAELSTQRAESGRGLLRAALIDAGVAEDGIDQAIANLVSGNGVGVADTPAPPAETPMSRTASLGALGGRPASFDPRGDEIRGLSGPDLIEAAIIAEAGQKRPS